MKGDARILDYGTYGLRQQFKHAGNKDHLSDLLPEISQHPSFKA